MPTHEDVERAIRLASAYLRGCVGGDGRFVYRVNTDPSVRVTPKYNMLRHAGAVWAMCNARSHLGDDSLVDPVLRAAAFLRSQVRAVEGVDGAALAVWSDPAVNGSRKPVQAKLGGTGLGLMALLSANETVPGTMDPDDLRGLGRFLVDMQEPDGRYVSKFVPSKGGKVRRWVSLYYPGEASLGLVMLHEIDPGGGWLGPAVRGLLYLADLRRGDDVVPADHWALIATARALPLIERGPGGLPADAGQKLVEHARQIVDQILGEQMVAPGEPDRDGGFSVDGRTTPTSTRLEGLQAAVRILPDDDPRRAMIAAAVDRGIGFLLRSQVTEGRFAGAWPRAVARRAGGSDSFSRRATEVRIDYVQHALSVMLNAARTDDH